MTRSRTIELPDDLNAFVEHMVQIGCHASTDDVVLTAIERYQEDIAAELERVAQIYSGEADMATLASFLHQYQSRHAVQLLPITQEFMARIEILVGRVPDIDIDLDKPIKGNVINE